MKYPATAVPATLKNNRRWMSLPPISIRVGLSIIVDKLQPVEKGPLQRLGSRRRPQTIHGFQRNVRFTIHRATAERGFEQISHDSATIHRRGQHALNGGT